MAVSVYAFVFGVLLTMWGILSLVDPERAFRLENIFQLRDVELSEFGIAMQHIGGALLIIVSTFLVATVLRPLAVVPLFVVSGLPFVRWYEIGPDWLVSVVK